MADPAPRTVTLPAPAWIGACVVVVAFLAIFVAQLVLIAEQRGLIDQQRKIAAVQATRARPVLGTLDAMLGDSPGPALKAAHRAGAALTGLQGLMSRLRGTDLVRLTAGALPRLVTATASAVRLLAIVAPAVRRSLEVQVRSLAVQEQSLSIQRRSLAQQQRVASLAQQTLAVARATLSHAASIDRKTGGRLAAPALP